GGGTPRCLREKKARQDPRRACGGAALARPLEERVARHAVEIHVLLLTPLRPSCPVATFDQRSIDAACEPGRNRRRPLVPVVRDERDAETSGRPGYASARGPPARIEDTVEQVAGEDRVAVAMRRDGFQARPGGTRQDPSRPRDVPAAAG